MVCPDVAISFKEGEREYGIDYDHCKGCGICAVECPRSAMTLEEEKWSE
jgi:Pyruvate/2-oxoacid:ferredoxin oxidoreductase delta subunit